MDDIAKLLDPWNSFYVMIGSAAAALTGLMFVVISLARDAERRASRGGVSVFSSPTVVHFSSALFIAALMVAPFRSSLRPIAFVLGFAGLFGLYYVVRVARQARQLDSYRPDLEDWVWHVGLTFVAYATLLAGALLLNVAPRSALFAPAAAAALLIFIGIHNAWDVVTFLATGGADEIDAAAGDAKRDD